MKKFILVFMLVLITAFSTVNVFAEISPEVTEAETDDNSTLDADGSNTSDTSPQTGVDLNSLYVVLISAAGIALVSAKQLAKEN